MNRDARPQYIESIESKHFDSTRHGSTFTSSKVRNVNDVLETAGIQRGSLAGDDRQKLIEVGADPSSFMSPESGVRYLMVETPSTQA